MLRDLLAALAASPTASSLELRTRLGLPRESYEVKLEQLVRLGYVQAAPYEEPSCASGPCHACHLRCSSSPPPTLWTVTERGHAFLRRAAARS